MKVCAPGKLILSGEHAVVYGQPALAMAVNYYATATVTRERLPHVLFDLSNLAHQSRLTLDGLRHLKENIKRKYARFVRGDFRIRDVLQEPFELAQVALGLLAEAQNLSLPHGVKIQVQSDIPIGSGMGSSAATILSVVYAVSHYLGVPMTHEAMYQLALQAENLQHGYSSGLDLRASLLGGGIYIHGEHIESRPLPLMPMHLVNTGTPQTTTGQCVEQVAAYFTSTQLGDDFAAVTKAMDDGLQTQSMAAMQLAIRENHRLLSHIGVVPEKVRQFISEIETLGAVAKTCGAGAVAGDDAGMVLVIMEDQATLTSLCARYGYTRTSIAGELRGVHAI